MDESLEFRNLPTQRGGFVLVSHATMKNLGHALLVLGEQDDDRNHQSENRNEDSEEGHIIHALSLRQNQTRGGFRGPEVVRSVCATASWRATPTAQKAASQT